MFRELANKQRANIEILKSKIDFKLHEKYNTDTTSKMGHDTFTSFIDGASLIIENENSHGYDHYLMIGPEDNANSFANQQIFEFLGAKDKSSTCVVYTVKNDEVDTFVEMLCNSVRQKHTPAELKDHPSYKSPMEFKAYIMMTTLMVNLFNIFAGNEKEPTNKKEYLN